MYTDHIFFYADHLKFNFKGMHSLEKRTLAYSYLFALRKRAKSSYVEKSLLKRAIIRGRRKKKEKARGRARARQGKARPGQGQGQGKAR